MMQKALLGFLSVFLTGNRKFEGPDGDRGVTRAVSTATPFQQSDAMPMFMLARDILSRLLAGKLEVASRDAERAKAEMLSREADHQSAHTLSEARRGALDAKLRRLEGLLAHSKEELDLAYRGKSAGPQADGSSVLNADGSKTAVVGLGLWGQLSCVTGIAQVLRMNQRGI